MSLGLQRRLSSAKRPLGRTPRHDLPVTLDGQGNQVVQVEPGVTAPADAVLGTADNKPLSAPGCLSLFNSAAASNKYFVRTSKPAAGSSLNVGLLAQTALAAWFCLCLSSFRSRCLGGAPKARCSKEGKSSCVLKPYTMLRRSVRIDYDGEPIQKSAHCTWVGLSICNVCFQAVTAKQLPTVMTDVSIYASGAVALTYHKPTKCIIT